MQQGIEYDFDKTMKGFIDLCTTWCEMKQNSNETPNLENLLDKRSLEYMFRELLKILAW